MKSIIEFLTYITTGVIIQAKVIYVTQYQCQPTWKRKLLGLLPDRPYAIPGPVGSKTHTYGKFFLGTYYKIHPHWRGK